MRMPGNFKKEDLRIIKTEKALMAAMSKLLVHQKFSQITVNSLCEEALVSRTTFYSYFADKYNFLEQWLAIIKSEVMNRVNDYESLENSINDFVNNNKRIIVNLLEDANDETYELLCSFLLSFLDISADKIDGGPMNPKYIVLSKFCSGGLVNYLKWQVGNRFPESLPIMNSHLYDLILDLLEWYKE